MTKQDDQTPEKAVEQVKVDLRDPIWAALLGWLWPGAGHLYQRRYAKGALFMVCILSTYFYGLALGDGHVVYASWRPNDYRWQYFCQLGTGIPAFPAMVQAIKVNRGGAPFFVTREFETDQFPKMRDLKMTGTLQEGFMAPPPGPIFPNDDDVLAIWHGELKHRFEIATLYTVVAGLLNLLAVYDAFAGPALPLEKRPEEDSPPDGEQESGTGARRR